MSAVFSSCSDAEGTDSPNAIVPCQAQPQATKTACLAVSAVLRKSAAIAELEALDRHIAWFAQLRDQSEARWKRNGCFAAKGDMDRWELMRLEAVVKRGAL